MAEAKVKTEKYILKPGQEHHGFSGTGENRVRHTYRGDERDNNTVELTEVQFNQLKDKFITEAAARDLQQKANELDELKKKQAALEAALQAKGISVEELLETSVKKPDAGVIATENEPTQAGNTPAPTGSSADPINEPPKPASAQPSPPKTGQK